LNTQMVKELVVRAGQELVKSGLAARTWGNVSCRLDENFFAITPSGRSYEIMGPEDIVICRIEDCTYEGNIKPSSEKKIHALLYKTCPDVNFVIHTHQPAASVLSAADINDMPSKGFNLLGDKVPVAAYGLPGTNKLTNGVAKALTNCRGQAVIMSNHGAICFGKDYEETFSAAQQLEEACLAFVHSRYMTLSSASAYNEINFYKYYVSLIPGKKSAIADEPIILGSSRRSGKGFIMEGDPETAFRLDDRTISGAALIHQAIYINRKDVNFIRQTSDSGLFAISLTNRPLIPLLDDFAQIVGLSARSARSSKTADVVKALKRHPAVLIPGSGALCCAATADDANAVKAIMEKNALAQIGTQMFGGGRAISRLDSLIMHLVYTMSYSKKAN